MMTIERFAKVTAAVAAAALIGWTPVELIGFEGFVAGLAVVVVVVGVVVVVVVAKAAERLVD